MPDPIPRNRSAGRSRPRRLTRRQRDWPGRLFGQRRENAEQPAPPPAQPRPPAHRHRAQGVWLGRPFGPHRENAEQRAQPPAPAQPRPPAARRRPAHRRRVWPHGPLRQRQGNVRPGPRPPMLSLTRSSSQVAVGVLLCAVAVLVIGIVVPPLFPSDTSSGSVVAAPATGQTGAAGSGDPGQVVGELAVPPAAPSADRVPTQPPTLVGNRTAVVPGGEASAPAGQSDPAPEPAPPADLAQRVDRPADQTPRPAERPANTESGNPEPKPQPSPPPPSGGPTRADYEKALQAAIQKYQSNSSGSNTRGGGNGSGGSSGGGGGPKGGGSTDGPNSGGGGSGEGGGSGGGGSTTGSGGSGSSASGGGSRSTGSGK